MSELRVFSDDPVDRVALLELVDGDLDVQKQQFSIDQPATFAVQEGSYLLRSHWSDGQRTDQAVNVGGGDLDLEVRPPQASDAALLELGDPLLVASTHREAAPVLDEAREPIPFEVELGRSRFRTDAEHGDAGTRLLRAMAGSFASESVADQIRELTFTLWRKSEEDNQWVDVGFSAEARPIEGGVEFELNASEALHVFELSSGNTTQYVSIPAERSIIGMRWYRLEETVHLRVDARTADRDIEALRGYIVRGELDVAKGIAPSVMAERYLRSKVAAPRIAALGAYFLLRIGDLDRLHDWPTNLSNWKPWLPDGPVIAAWQRLRSPNPDYEEVFELLLEGEQRGLPIYTEGVRLLKDGLDLFAADDEKTWDVQDARSRIESYAQAMVWNKSETTYFGTAIDEPRPYESENLVAWSVVDPWKAES